MGCHGDSGPAVEGIGCYPQEEKPRNRNLKSFSYKTEYEANVDCIYLCLPNPDNVWNLRAIFHCMKASCTNVANL